MYTIYRERIERVTHCQWINGWRNISF